MLNHFPTGRDLPGWRCKPFKRVFSPVTLFNYLGILKDTANAIACLTSVPLTDRRFLLDFPDRAQKLQMPGLVGGFIDLILPEDPIEPDWELWIDGWRNSYSMLLKQPDIPIDPWQWEDSPISKKLSSIFTQPTRKRPCGYCSGIGTEFPLYFLQDALRLVLLTISAQH